MPVETVCLQCNKTFSVKPVYLKLGRAKCCSKSCSFLYRTGKNIKKQNKPPHNYSNEDKFWSRVDKTGECWIWQGSCDDKMGYGRVTYHGKPWASHRLAYYFTYGSIPSGMGVLHRCDNPKCCNPNHLFIGTHHDNTQDRIAKNRTAHGVASGTHKLTPQQVEYIRSFSRPVPLKKLSQEIGVTVGTIYNVYVGKQWKHHTSAVLALIEEEK